MDRIDLGFGGDLFLSSSRLLDAVLKQDQRITFAVLVDIECNCGIDYFGEPDGFRAGKDLMRWLTRQADHQFAIFGLHGEQDTRDQFVSADEFL